MKKNKLFSQKAFTLIEILMVVIVMGIVLALAAPSFSKGYSHLQFNKTVDDLLSVSRWAQAMAISRERTYALSFTEDHRYYDLQQMQINEETGQEGGFKPVDGTLGRMHAIARDIDIDMDQDRVQFYPDGTIDPAAIQLSGEGQKTTLSSTAVRGMMTKESPSE